MQDFFYKIKLIDILSLCKSYLLGMLGSLTVFIMVQLFSTKPYQIGAINITGIVDQFVKHETKLNLTPEILRKEIKSFGTRVERELKIFAIEKHLILLPTQAVVSGAKDYTSIILNRISKDRLMGDA